MLLACVSNADAILYHVSVQERKCQWTLNKKSPQMNSIVWGRIGSLEITKADTRIRTADLLFTKQLLYH